MSVVHFEAMEKGVAGRRARRVRSLAGSVLTLLLLVCAAEREARAYTDPGSGALLWQMLVAGFVGGLFYLRKFAGWFRSQRKH